MQTLTLWRGSPEWSLQISLTTSCSEAHARRLGLVNDWREYLTNTDEHNSTNYELYLRTGRPSGAAVFLDQLERVIGTSLRRKKGDY